MKLSTAKNVVRSFIEHNLNNTNGSNASYLCPMLWSLPGEGKTTMIEDLTESMGLELITVIFAQFDAGELGGFPMVDKDAKQYYRARPFFLPTEGKGVIFLDELPQAPKANQNIAAQLTNERRIGEHKLPEGWTVVCAGNPLAAKAGTQDMPSHLKDRLTHLEIETDHEGFREYALSHGFDPVITSFINERPEWLQKFDPKQNASPSPRSWERTNTILGLKLDIDSENAAIKGQIGEAGLADFTGYKRVWKDLPKAQSIFDAPDTHSIPDDPSILYALCSSLAHKANKSNASALITYIERFPNKEFSAFCMKDTLQRHPELMSDKLVSEWFLTEGKDLML